jgi:hypothetical protein
MLKFVAVLMTIAVLAAGSHLLAVSRPAFHSTEDPTMMTMPRIAVNHVKLLAREEKSAPLGAPPQADRPVGFADVFIYLENPGLETQEIRIDHIEIRDSFGVILEDAIAQTVELKPMQHSEQDFHLTNRKGYSWWGRVRAVVTYTVGDRTQVIESLPVQVKRHG